MPLGLHKFIFISLITLAITNAQATIKKQPKQRMPQKQNEGRSRPPDTSLLNPTIGMNAVRRMNIMQGAVDNTRIADNAVTTAKIATGNISTPLLAVNIQKTLAGSSNNDPNTLIKRDRNGNFSAGTITADLIGNVTGTITNPNVIGNINIQGNQTTEGNFTSNGDTTIAGDNGLQVNNAASIGGEMIVSGATCLSNSLDVDGPTQINNQLTLYGGNLTITGNRDKGGNLFVAGTIKTPSSYGNSVTNQPNMLFIDTNGNLGTLVSSGRYKENIQDLQAAANIVERLRPVSFTYKTDPAKQQQYGLIAEEVAAVAPELVIYNKNLQPETVAYHHLVPLLLSTCQQQSKQLRKLEDQVARMQQAFNTLLLLLKNQSQQ